jgi:pimeloyl-ACP methyl ester carboxylesterase
VAVWLRWSGHGAAGRRPRAHLSRPLLERTFPGPEAVDEAKRQHYAALFAQPGAMRAGFAQFLAFSQDAADNKTFLAQGKLQMPVLAFGGEATFGPMIGEVIRCVADNVEDAIIPDCGHWITEEQPQATTDLVVEFLRRAR